MGIEVSSKLIFWANDSSSGLKNVSPSPHFQGEMMRKLTPVISVLEDKCINCHACIAACPIKFCNDGSGDHVKINARHLHRLRRLHSGLHARCAGAAGRHREVPRRLEAARAHGDRRRSRGGRELSRPLLAVERLDEVDGHRSRSFDVSFGAELTIKSYLDHVDEEQSQGGDRAALPGDRHVHRDVPAGVAAVPGAGPQPDAAHRAIDPRVLSAIRRLQNRGHFAVRRQAARIRRDRLGRLQRHLRRTREALRGEQHAVGFLSGRRVRQSAGRTRRALFDPRRPDAHRDARSPRHRGENPQDRGQPRHLQVSRRASARDRQGPLAAGRRLPELRIGLQRRHGNQLQGRRPRTTSNGSSSSGATPRGRATRPKPPKNGKDERRRPEEKTAKRGFFARWNKGEKRDGCGCENRRADQGSTARVHRLALEARHLRPELRQSVGQRLHPHSVRRPRSRKSTRSS